MAGPRVSVELVGEGGQRFVSKLNELAVNLEDIPRLAPMVFEALAKYHDATWGDGTTVQPSTLRRWPNTDHLVLGATNMYGRESGTLKRSLTTPLPGPDKIRIITPWGFAFGTHVKWASYLVYGTRKMTPKPVLKPIQGVRAVIGRIVARHVFRPLEY